MYIMEIALSSPDFYKQSVYLHSKNSYNNNYTDKTG